MSNIQTLNKVVEIAEKRRDEARASLAQQQRELQIAQDQMKQLQTYAQEAQARWSTPAAWTRRSCSTTASSCRRSTTRSNSSTAC